MTSGPPAPSHSSTLEILNHKTEVTPTSLWELRAREGPSSVPEVFTGTSGMRSLKEKALGWVQVRPWPRAPPVPLSYARSRGVSTRGSRKRSLAGKFPTGPRGWQRQDLFFCFPRILKKANPRPVAAEPTAAPGAGRLRPPLPRPHPRAAPRPPAPATWDRPGRGAAGKPGRLGRPSAPAQS